MAFLPGRVAGRSRPGRVTPRRWQGSSEHLPLGHCPPAASLPCGDASMNFLRTPCHGPTKALTPSSRALAWHSRPLWSGPARPRAQPVSHRSALPLVPQVCHSRNYWTGDTHRSSGLRSPPSGLFSHGSVISPRLSLLSTFIPPPAATVLALPTPAALRLPSAPSARAAPAPSSLPRPRLSCLGLLHLLLGAPSSSLCVSSGFQVLHASTQMSAMKVMSPAPPPWPHSTVTLFSCLHSTYHYPHYLFYCPSPLGTPQEHETQGGQGAHPARCRALPGTGRGC